MPHLPTPNRWRLAALALAMLLPSAGTSIANVALPTLATTFGASSQDVQWVVIAYLLATTTLIVAAGRLGDMFGRRRLLLGGIALFVLASLAAALAPALWILVAARAVQGLGAAVMMALAVAMVADVVPRERSGSAMGLLGSISALGTALGPSLGGALIAVFGWQAVFHVLSLLALAALALAFRTLPRDRSAEGERRALDSAGIAALALALGAYALASTLEVDLGTTALLAGMALAALVVFIQIERTTVAPLVELRELRNPILSAGLVSIGLVSAILMATLVAGPFYLAGALGLGPLETGLVMSVGPALAAIAGVPAGRMVDRVGSKQLAFAGLVGVVSGSMLLALLAPVAGVVGYLAGLSLITAGYALFQSANNTAVMQIARQDRRGAVSGLLALARNLGLISGASIMGTIYAAGAAGLVFMPAGDEAGLRATFGTATVLALAAVLVSVFGNRADAC